MSIAPTPTHRLLEWSLDTNTILMYCNHAAIFLVGWFLVVLFFFPNGMLSDSGTPMAHGVACFGMIACLLLAIGACVGLVTGQWWTLLPGVAAEVLLLGSMPLLFWCSKRREPAVDVKRFDGYYQRKSGADEQVHVVGANPHDAPQGGTLA